MSAGKIALLIVGIVVVVVAIGLIATGGAVLWANGFLTDDEGYLTTKTIRIDEGSYAVVSEPTDIEVGSWWVWDWGDLASFKIEGSNDDSSKNIFMGLADESDSNSYLIDVNYDEVIDMDINPDRLDFRNRPGNSEPAIPTTQDFWLESVNGPGTQTLAWDMQAGTWSLVLMNEDGSAGVDLSVVLGVKIPWLFGTGLGLLIGGIVTLPLGTLMIILAVRRS
jgi:hypothetical protein